jgi:hypothetical protein
LNTLAGSGLFWTAMALSGLCLIAQGRLPAVAGQNRLRALARVALQVAVVFWPVFAAVLLWPGAEPDIKGLLGAAVLGASGWLVTHLRALKERDEDALDLMDALRAEIWVHLNDLVRNSRPLPDDVSVSAGAPYATLPAPSVVFAATAPQVARLPSGVIDAVVQFYILLETVRQFALDLRNPAFADRPAEVRVDAYRTYVKNRRDLTVLARSAVVELNRALGVPDPENLPLEVNTADRAPRDPGAEASDANGRSP